MSDPKSAALFERAEKVIVGGVNSPVRAFRAVGGGPIFITKASGAMVYGADGRGYVQSRLKKVRREGSRRTRI